MNLTICVGEHCHLSGSEVVVKAVMKLLADEGLEDGVRLRGAFCLGECSGGTEVTVRCGEHLLHTAYKDADVFARERLLPLLRSAGQD